jgi:hypothetical protein
MEYGPQLPTTAPRFQEGETLNWKLILTLSLFGLAMGVATVFVVPSNVEPFFWLVIFIICAVIIARAGVPRPFVHGLLVSVVNSVWIIAAHELFLDRYLAGHAREAGMPTGGIPLRLAMVLFGLVIGVLSGLVLGFFAWVASRLLKPVPSGSREPR